MREREIGKRRGERETPERERERKKHQQETQPEIQTQPETQCAQKVFPTGEDKARQTHCTYEPGKIRALPFSIPGGQPLGTEPSRAHPTLTPHALLTPVNAETDRKSTV